MQKPRICATIIDSNIELIKENEHDVDLFEVRIDLIGSGWIDLVKYLNKPWIACNRCIEEGGQGDTDQVKRIEELLWAAEAGACIVDLEVRTKNLADVVPLVKAKTQLLLSFHDLVGTPSYDTLVGIVQDQIHAGADFCKVVTTAQTFEDNLTILKLLDKFPEIKLVALAMGEEGRISRLLSPLCGGYLTYASLEPGKESASGQLSVKEMNTIYQSMRK